MSERDKRHSFDISLRDIEKPKKSANKTHVAIIPAAKALLTLLGSRIVLMDLVQEFGSR